MSFSLAKSCHTLGILLLVIVVTNFLSPKMLSATESLVTGKYISSSGTDLVLQLSIRNPAPANLIVEQNLPPENTIINTAPQAKKIDNSLGNVKWLFKNTRDGILPLSIRLSTPLRGDVSAIVRYRTPQSGSFVELRITP